MPGNISIYLQSHCPDDPVLLYKTQCLVPCASSSLKHEAYAKSWWGLASQKCLWGSDFSSHNPELQGSTPVLGGLGVAQSDKSFLWSQSRLWCGFPSLEALWGLSNSQRADISRCPLSPFTVFLGLKSGEMDAHMSPCSRSLLSLFSISG